MSETIMVNIYGGPGCGKSTTAAGVFTLLKIHKIDCELVTEFAKDLTWENRHKTLENQLQEN
jgi:ABC-type glutathione transport system ATPase component